MPRAHGAWAMIALAALIGVARSRGSLIQVPLIAFWLCGYAAFNAWSVWVASRRRHTHLRPLLVYTSAATALGVVTLILRPDLAALIPFFIPLLALAAWSVWTRRERNILGNLATIGASSMFGYVVYMAGYRPDGTIFIGRATMMWICVLVAAYLFGTSLYVKTIIRQRRSQTYKWASISYHLAWTMVWAILAARPLWQPPGVSTRAAIASCALFCLLSVRAAWLAGRNVRPMHVGLGELAFCAAVFIIAVRVW